MGSACLRRISWSWVRRPTLLRLCLRGLCTWEQDTHRSIIGGTPESQREFLETFSADTSADPSLVNEKRKGKTPPIANHFALGYTYRDVLDADQEGIAVTHPLSSKHQTNSLAEDTLARVSAYLLSEPSPSFAPLLKPLLTPQSVPETLVVILMDWSDPWTWIRRLREWVRLLRSVLVSLDDETKIVMEETMTEWRDRKRGMDANSATAGGLPNSGGPVTIPLGPGEWDEGLGIPMCVVCQGVSTSKSTLLDIQCSLANHGLCRPIKLRSWKRTTAGMKSNSTSSSNSCAQFC